MKKVLINIFITLILIIISSVITIFVINKNYDIGKINDSLVYIESYDGEEISSGSGFAYKKVNNKYYIITCYHIIENKDNIYIYDKHNNKVKANIIGYDIDSDIAIIEVEDKLNLKTVKIGNSDKIAIGDLIYAVGAPIDYRYFGTVTKGIVSYLDREIKVNGKKYNTIQFDANINLGNSGGPLLNKKGEVVGMVFIKENDINGVNFAISSNNFMKIIDKIEKNNL